MLWPVVGWPCLHPNRSNENIIKANWRIQGSKEG